MILNRIFVAFIITSAYANYWESKRKFIQNEESMAVGANLKLNKKEGVVNQILMTAKYEDMKNSSLNIEEHIENSEVFKIIRRMPKGAALHIHDLTIFSIDYLLFNITYRDNLYICINEDDIKFKFAAFDPDEDCWKSVKLTREEERFVEDFDNWLRSKLSLDNEENELIEKKVLKIMEIIKPLLLYRPAFFDYIYNAIEDLYNDNVMYVELHGYLPILYDLDGTVYNSLDTLKQLNQINNQFVEDHPDFIGFKYIYTSETNSTIKENLQLFEDMKQIYPNFLRGLDIRFHEPIIIDQLMEVSKRTNIFFYESSMDIIDAILLNTTRIECNYELFKHPLALEEIKRKQIAIEVCPNSKDSQKLPVGYLLATGYPVLISSCGSYFKDAKGLSYDYYEAFMRFANKNADLKMLKQLFINSILYSSLTSEEKTNALLGWEQKWNLFLDEIVVDNNYVE